MIFHSPLRYPGGKRKLSNFIKLICYKNNLLDGQYIEPYAGGASIALNLLFDEYVRYIHINDIDISIYAFWHSVLNETEAICRMINDIPVTMDMWYRQKEIQNDPHVSLLELGFSTFFMNRTNRSGIIGGGVIGGKKQNGTWKLDARYNKQNLISRIHRIARYESRIHLYNLDAVDLLNQLVPRLPKSTLIYLDPPYYVKGRYLLYTNFYKTTDHEIVANCIKSIKNPWIVSYDNVPEILDLYKGFRRIEYDLSYSAQERYKGKEVMFFCTNLIKPDILNPANIKSKEIYLFQQQQSITG